MDEEGQELRLRMNKLTVDKEELSRRLAEAEAERDAAPHRRNETAAPSSQEYTNLTRNLRTVQSEREALKDDVTNKEGQLMLLRSQLEIRDRKLSIADMENKMLKNELDLLRKS